MEKLPWGKKTPEPNLGGYAHLTPEGKKGEKGNKGQGKTPENATPEKESPRPTEGANYSGRKYDPNSRPIKKGKGDGEIGHWELAKNESPRKNLPRNPTPPEFP